MIKFSRTVKSGDFLVDLFTEETGGPVPSPDYRTEQEKLENVLHGLKKINQPNRIEG